MTLYKHAGLSGTSELGWPSGKALGWQVEGPRFDPLQLSFLFKNCGLWTLCSDFSHTMNENINMAHTAAHLNEESLGW